MNIYDLGDLQLAVSGATPAYLTWLDKQANKDAEAGTELIFENEKYKIFIPNNKGAACELGKGTTWCTAAPGLDYYNHYHKPEDPLFIIFKKDDRGKDGWSSDVVQKNPSMKGIAAKYQFHYGTGQYMDAEDVPILQYNPNADIDISGIDLLKEIHGILVQTVGDRFPFLKDAFVET